MFLGGLDNNPKIRKCVIRMELNLLADYTKYLIFTLNLYCLGYVEVSDFDKF